MLTEEEQRRVYENAYVPEQLISYVEAVADAEPYIHGNYLCFFRQNHLIFIGYPLIINKTSDIKSAYESACEQFSPATVAITAPDIWLPAQTYAAQPKDIYYRLDLPLGPLNPKVSYMLRRAHRELRITLGAFGTEHERLVQAFLSGHDLGREQKEIFNKIPHYLKRSGTARLFEARKGDFLIACSIMDLGAADYAFYLFNFRSVEEHIPGASDLLFYEMMRLAQNEGKGAMNLGLGIHSGVRHFKEKWGAIPFLPYSSGLVRRRPFEMDTLLGKL